VTARARRRFRRAGWLEASTLLFAVVSCRLLVDPGDHYLQVAATGGAPVSSIPPLHSYDHGGAGGSADGGSADGGSAGGGVAGTSAGGVGLETGSGGGGHSAGHPGAGGANESGDGGAAPNTLGGSSSGGAPLGSTGGRVSNTGGSNTVLSCKTGVNTGNRPLVVAFDQQRPTSVRIDSDYVYWIDEAVGEQLGKIMRVRRDGTALVVLADNLNRPNGLYLKPNYDSMLFGNDLPDAPGLYEVQNEEHGAVTPLDRDGLGVATLTGFGTSIYSEAWSPSVPTRIRKSNSGVKGAQGGCYPATLSGEDARVGAIGADKTQVYYVKKGGDIVYRTGMGCSDTSLPFLEGLPGIVAILPGHLYERVFFLTSSALWVTPKDDPIAITPYGVASGAEAMAMADAGMVFTNAGDGSIRVASDGATRLLACGQVEPNSIAVNENDEAVAWTDRGSGQVLLLERW
jgi:hypothetical protein